MIIVVQDANILIDLYEAGLLEAFFRLGFESHSTDLILNEIDQPVHGYVQSGQIRQHSLTPEQLEQTFSIQSVSEKGVSLPDCLALWLVKELGNATRLLTGDAKLRQSAENKGIIVHGLLWVFDQIVEKQIISPNKMAARLAELLSRGSRLPKNECQKRTTDWQK